MKLVHNKVLNKVVIIMSHDMSKVITRKVYRKIWMAVGNHVTIIDTQVRDHVLEE